MDFSSSKNFLTAFSCFNMSKFSIWLSNNILSSHLLQQNIEKKRRRKKLLEGRIVLPQEYPYVCLRREGRKEEENEGGWDIERKKSLHKKP